MLEEALVMIQNGFWGDVAICCTSYVNDSAKVIDCTIN